MGELDGITKFGELVGIIAKKKKKGIDKFYSKFFDTCLFYPRFDLDFVICYVFKYIRHL